jgi:hypothetical protein
MVEEPAIPPALAGVDFPARRRRADGTRRLLSAVADHLAHEEREVLPLIEGST